MTELLKVNNESIRIRPSAVDTFYGCSWQWAKSFLEGVSSIPNSRAAIGTAIHKGIEASWQEAMSCGKAEHNVTMMLDAAMDEWKEETKEGVSFGNDETSSTCEREIKLGIEAWKDDISPFIAIPEGVEQFFKVDISNPFVTELGGTIDYIGHGIIDDVKTSKRKVTPSSYETQQSIYKYLAEANGKVVNHSRLQNVVLKKQPDGQILTLEPNVEKAKNLVNGILETLEVFHQGHVPAHVLFRGNPKYMYCSDKFCAHYDTCPFVKGKAPEPRKADIAAIKL